MVGVTAGTGLGTCLCTSQMRAKPRLGKQEHYNMSSKVGFNVGVQTRFVVTFGVANAGINPS